LCNAQTNCNIEFGLSSYTPPFNTTAGWMRVPDLFFQNPTNRECFAQAYNQQYLKVVRNDTTQNCCIRGTGDRGFSLGTGGDLVVVFINGTDACNKPVRVNGTLALRVWPSGSVILPSTSPDFWKLAASANCGTIAPYWALVYRNTSCSDYKACNSCVSTNVARCQWCLDTSQCYSNGTLNCPSWTKNPRFCPQDACSFFTTCNVCSSQGCVWCQDQARCSGNDIPGCEAEIRNPVFCPFQSTAQQALTAQQAVETKV